VVLLIPGIFFVGFILYTTLKFEIKTSGFTKAKINFLEPNEADTTDKTVIYNVIDANGKEQSIIDEKPDKDDGTALFDEVRVRFDVKNPTKLYFENSWLGTALSLIFGSIFIVIGYTGIFKINLLQKPRRVIVPYIAFCILLVGCGLMTDFIVSLEKNQEERLKYEYIAALIILIGTVLLAYWFSIQKMWREIDTIGVELIIKDFSVASIRRLPESGSNFYEKLNLVGNKNNELELTDENTGVHVKVQIKRDIYSSVDLNPFIITCNYIDENNNSHTFKSDYIWFDPTPFMQQKIKVWVHPKNNKYYKIDTSFLPKVDLGISRTSYI
jgi:hypothetical protein